ncbi:TetR/AcrR family transcriptional regulator [Streptomyces sp. NPDC003656]|uniref:TetR/AcrR family transcriptional regulator n=1 Tax=unclassified Streptomyces TaxID=2593676 RepID=UPI0018F733C9|nr:TetR/AcrR family transcriptional regulator [Streptomyces sp. DSM 110735]MBJ7902478.1 TetR family transcriptional regulator [Streptomyces sp. DSM 110735]
MRETTTAPGLRLRTRRLVTEALSDTALELFDASGYEQVTVADIARAAGISQRSFFRYFGNKEDVVFGDRVPGAEEVREELCRHLDGQPAWDALRDTFVVAAEQMDADAGRWKRATRVICHTPALRARYLEKHLAWTGALVPEIAARIDSGGPVAELKARTMVNTALACFDVALERWADDAGGRSLADLVGEVFGFVRIPHEPSGA